MNIYLNETSPDEVDKIIAALDTNKAADIYGISAKAIKAGGLCIAEIISRLFNIS